MTGAVAGPDFETPHVALLAGLLCDGAVWEEQCGALDGTASTHVRWFTQQETITEMAEFVIDSCPKQMIVVGHSMGGRVALEVVRLAPERVCGLVLLNTGIHTRRDGELEKRQKLVDIAYRDGMAALSQHWLPPMMTERSLDDAALTARLTEMICRSSPDTFARQIRALLCRPDPAPHLSAIRCPTVLASGRLDDWSPLSQHAEIARRIAGSQLCGLDDCGHMSIVEQPRTVATLLKNFIAGLEHCPEH